MGWAIAACTLLAVGGLAYPTASYLSAYSRVRDDLASAEHSLNLASAERKQLVETRNSEVATATEKIENTKKQLKELLQKRNDDLEMAEETIRKMDTVLEVTGPPAIQPGAPNSFHVITRRMDNGNTVSSRLNIRLIDADKNVLYEENDVHSQGMYTLHLPVDVTLKPNTQLALDVTASSEGRVRSELKERLDWAAPRYVTHLTTDKPMYQPGQTVFFRSLTLNRASLQPPDEDFYIEFSIADPSGAKIHTATGETRLRSLSPNNKEAKAILGPDGKPVRGIGVGEFLLVDSPTFRGGEFILTVRELNGRFPEERRKFLVNKYTPDRISKELDFHRKTYGAGDDVIANCKFWNETGPLVNRPIFAAVANVDGKEIVAHALGRTDSLGRVSVQFKLPSTIDQGRASLTVVISDDSAQESIQKPIPLVVNKIFVKFFAEGGDLVAGLANRVYFRATTPLDKPAELKGRILDAKGQEIAKAETLNDDTDLGRGANQGLGAFVFTPKAGEKYVLKVDEPKGIEKTIELPAVKDDGVILSVPTGVTGPGEVIRAELAATGKARRLLVGAYCRGRMLDHQRVETTPGKSTIVELKPGDDIGGVVRITVFEEQTPGARQTYEPRAERLVFRKSAKTIKFTVTPDKTRFAPGEKPTLTISATDEMGLPARAITTASVVNETIITMADEKTARSLSTFFAFVGEVRKAEDLEFADFLLTDHPKTPVALDLLLGTQGWRRFAEQHPNQRRQDHNAEVERILVMWGQVGQRVMSSLVHNQQKIEAEFQPKFKDLDEQLKQVVGENQAVKSNAEFPKKLTEKDALVKQRATDYQAALAGIAPFDDTNAQIRASAVPMLGGLALLLSLVCLLVGVVRGARAGLPYFVTAAGSLSVCALLLIGFAMSGDAKGGRGNIVADAGVKIAAPAPTGPMTRPEVVGAQWDRAAGLKEDGKLQEHMREGGARAMAPKMAMPPGPDGFGGPAKPGDAGFAPAPPAAPAAADAPAALAMGQDKLKAGVNGVKRDLNDLAKANNRFADDMEREKMAKMPAGDFKKKADEAGDAFRRAQGNQVRMQRVGEEKNAEYRKELAKVIDGVVAKDARAGKGAGGFGGGAAGLGGPGGGGFGGRGMPAGGGGGFGPAAGFPGGRPFGGMPAEQPFQPAPEPFFFREFAHVNLLANSGTREDFAETVYWNPVLVLDEIGKQKISFQLADSITKYRVQIGGHTLEGRIGSGTHLIEARKPFGLEAKLPAEVTASDKLDIPVLITNDSDNQRVASMTVLPKGLQLRSGSENDRFELAPNQRSRRVMRLQPSIVDGDAELRIEGKGEPFAEDKVVRSVKVVPEGFPTVGQASDLLEKVAENELVLPKDYVKGSLKVWASIYPSTLADLQKGLEALLREPGGCFEQTSTTNYPNTLILNYIKESGESNPAAVQRASELLDRGYQRLTSFECQKPQGGREGYEWFGGQAPPHEALTAYGLLQFKDMAKVHAVDQEMLDRTRKYLLGRRKPDGGFERNPRALDTFGGAPQHITDAYIIWAMTETGKEDLTKDIDKLLKEHADSKDPYFLSLVANALLNCDGADRAKQAMDLLKRVRDQQAEDGGLNGAETSITRSGGRELRIETTALAVLGWLKANRPADFTQSLQKAVKWISQQRGGYGGFGSTQSTILALKALIAHTKASKQTAEDGTLVLTINGQEAERLRFMAGRQEPVTIMVKEPEKLLKDGENALKLELVGKNKYPYTIGWSYSALTPNSSEKCAVKLETKLNKEQVKEGDGVRLNVTLENLSKDKGQPMTVAIVGLPAGLKVPEDMKQLKELATLRKGDGDAVLPGEISFFEIRGRELVLYWRDMKPGAKIDLAIDLVADIPGEYRGPASRAYLYYTSDDKHWVEPLKIVIESEASK
jgi:uncharacterized membrane protein YgcG